MELAADERRLSRAAGYAKMDERDQGYQRLSNGTTMLWSVGRPLEDGEARRNVPENMFALVIDGREHFFDTDEFRNSLRWA